MNRLSNAVAGLFACEFNYLTFTRRHAGDCASQAAFRPESCIDFNRLALRIGAVSVLKSKATVEAGASIEEVTNIVY